MKDFVTCAVCGKRMKQLSSHIRIHNMKAKDYKEQFPGEKLQCDSILLSKSKKLSGEKNPMYGKPSPFYGRMHTEETKTRIREKRAKQVIDDNWRENHKRNTPRGNKHGMKRPEVRDKFKGENNPFYGKKHTKETKRLMSENNAAKRPEVKEKISKAMKKRWRNGEIKPVGKFTRTKPHMIVLEILEELGLEYEEEKQVKSYRVDFYLPEYDAFIEANGDYFHGNPTKYSYSELNEQQRQRVQNDLIKSNILKDKPILYLWNSDLQMNVEVCKQLVLKLVKGEITRAHSYEYTGGYQNYDKTL